MQDYDSQLNDFLLWLDEIETPINTLHQDSSNKAALEDRDQVRMWAHNHRVSHLIMAFDLWILRVFEMIARIRGVPK